MSQDLDIHINNLTEKAAAASPQDKVKVLVHGLADLLAAAIGTSRARGAEPTHIEPFHDLQSSLIARKDDFIASAKPDPAPQAQPIQPVAAAVEPTAQVQAPA